MKYFDAPALKHCLGQELCHRRVSPESARHVAASLVETSLRGIDSHGINLFPYYVSAVEGGRINRTPNLRIVARRPAAATLDADRGFGHHSGSEAIALALELASQSGVAVVGVRNSTHFGAASYFALQAARQGYAAFAFTNADALVRAHGAGESFFGTNPICFAAPMAAEEPFCLDMATSHVSWNKVMNRRRSGESLPDGWACDEKGRPTNDPMLARMLEPSGSYKGYGLGMMVEILCAVLVDGPLDKDILPMYGSPLGETRNISHFFMAINVGDFVNLERFSQRMRELAVRIRALTPQADAPVMIPGDPEKLAFELRSREGIPVDEHKYAEFIGASAAFAAAVRA